MRSAPVDSVAAKYMCSESPSYPMIRVVLRLSFSEADLSSSCAEAGFLNSWCTFKGQYSALGN